MCDAAVQCSACCCALHAGAVQLAPFRFWHHSLRGPCCLLSTHLLQSRTVRDLEVEIENMGGHLNAYTSREQVPSSAGAGQAAGRGAATPCMLWGADRIEHG